MKLNIGVSNKLTKSTLCIFVYLFLSSCGGGSDASIEPPTQIGSSDWDTMEWNLDNWG